MTQEDKELLLKDLCARLPYGVKCEGVKRSIDGEMLFIRNGSAALELTVDNVKELVANNMYEIKPYLFPLSSMTLEQRCKLRDLLPNNCDISFKNQKITFYDEGNIRLEQLEKIFHFFNLFHFDYRGLIEKGLAIDATGLNIY